MQSDLPKVLHRLNDKPMILHVLDNLREAGVDRIIVVVGYRGEEVIDAVGSKAETVWQRQQLGTGHAVMQAEKALERFSGKVVVACGDVPLIRPSTFSEMIDRAGDDRVKAVVLTMMMTDPKGYGRIVRDSRDEFIRIIEEKDASEDVKLIGEVNTGTYVFDKEFLFKGLAGLDRNNAQGEYYLTDALQYVVATGFRVIPQTLSDSTEGRGVNSREELSLLEDYLKR